MSKRVLSEVRYPGYYVFFPLSRLLAEDVRIEVWLKRDEIGGPIQMVADLIRQDLRSGVTGMSPLGKW